MCEGSRSHLRLLWAAALSTAGLPGTQMLSVEYAHHIDLHLISTTACRDLKVGESPLFFLLSDVCTSKAPLSERDDLSWLGQATYRWTDQWIYLNLPFFQVVLTHSVKRVGLFQTRVWKSAVLAAVLKWAKHETPLSSYSGGKSRNLFCTCSVKVVGPIYLFE